MRYRPGAALVGLGLSGIALLVFAALPFVARRARPRP
jgi:hypothetical protein